LECLIFGNNVDAAPSLPLQRIEMGYDAAVVEFAYIELLRRTNLQRVRVFGYVV